MTVGTAPPGAQRAPTSRRLYDDSQRVPVVPHPSDQATPASPRDTTETVDQLRSSLRQVADALAQTVAAVRSTREQLLEGRNGAEALPTSSEVDMEREVVGGGGDQHMAEGEGSRAVGEGEVRMETSEASLAPSSSEDPATPQRSVPELIPFRSSTPRAASTTSSHAPTNLVSPPTTTVTSTPPPTTATPTLTAPSSVPIMATFDGSQESARATLASTNPEDPLYTFLSAVAGAPAPPLPEASLSPPPDSLPRSLSSPRLPVFAQFQSPSTLSRTTTSSEDPTEPRQLQLQQPQASHSFSHGTSIPMSVIQDTRNLVPVPSATTAPAGVVVTETQQHLPGIESTPSASSGATLVSSNDSEAATNTAALVESIASQVTNFFMQGSEPPQDTNLPPYAAASAVIPPPPSTTAATEFANAVAQAELAQELARAAIKLMSTTDTTQPADAAESQLEPTTTTTALVSSLSSPSVIVPAITSSIGQSPSPSDTLAPLISSLQLPTAGGSSQAEASPPTQPTTEERAIQQQATTGDVEIISVQVEVQGQEHPVGGSDLAAELASERTRDGVIVAAGSLEPSIQQPQGDMLTSTGLSQRTGQTSLSGREVTRQSGSVAESGGPSASVSGEGGATASAGVSSEGVQPSQEIDPAFLAALPDSIRQEVLAQHERERRTRTRRQEDFHSSISPEFLAALPPNIQEEVGVGVCVCVGVCVYT